MQRHANGDLKRAEHNARQYCLINERFPRQGSGHALAGPQDPLRE